MDGSSWGREDTAQAVFDYIATYYNRRRRHSTLGYQAPAIFEAKAAGARTPEHTAKVAA